MSRLAAYVAGFALRMELALASPAPRLGMLLHSLLIATPTALLTASKLATSKVAFVMRLGKFV